MAITSSRRCWWPWRCRRLARARARGRRRGWTRRGFPAATASCTRALALLAGQRARSRRGVEGAHRQARARRARASAAAVPMPAWRWRLANATLPRPARGQRPPRSSPRGVGSDVPFFAAGCFGGARARARRAARALPAGGARRGSCWRGPASCSALPTSMARFPPGVVRGGRGRGALAAAALRDERAPSSSQRSSRTISGPAAVPAVPGDRARCVRSCSRRVRSRRA